MIDLHSKPQTRAAKFLIQSLDGQPDAGGQDCCEAREHERGPARLLHLELGPRNVVMNVAALVKFHQNKRDHEADRCPFQTTQKEIKHSMSNLTPHRSEEHT